MYNLLNYKALMLALLFLSTLNMSMAQDNSNKGTDFWLGFMDHIEGDDANMYLYVTSDTNAKITVSIPGQSWSANYNVVKNSMTLVTVPTDKSRVSCSDCTESKGIHLTSDLPVVVYSHIYETYKSDATLVLPTSTTGKEYYCMSYTQVQQRNDPNESSQFMIVASQDSTKINITPSCDIIKSSGVHSSNTTYSITLNKGEVYQGKGVINGKYANADVSGTFIQVIDTGKYANCRTVAVFSGSSNSMIGCTDNRASSDILFEQMFPKSSLGNRYIVVPSKDKTSDIVRVMASESGTVARIGSSNYNLTAGRFHEFTISNNQVTYIRSNKPLMVAQYHTSQLRCGGGYGDPSMIMLTPVEQTLEDIVLYSASRQRITKNFINVVIPTTGASSFRIDGNTVSFTQVPSYTAYSYAQIPVTSGNHRLTADEGFNAIAYGFGSYESYGYAAGANIKNRSVYIDLANSNYENDLGVCQAEQVQFEGKAGTNTIVKWEWDFGDGSTDTVQNPKHDYKKPGVYDVIIKAYKKTNNGCSTFDSSVLQLSIFATPKADFSFTLGCEGDAVIFSDSTKIDSGYEMNTNIWDLGGPPYKFGDKVSKIFPDTGFYTITNEAVSLNKCRHKATKLIYINPKPKVNFGYQNLCSGQNTNFVDSSSIEKGNLVHWNWVFGNNLDSIQKQNASYTFPSFGSNAVKLIVRSDSGCINSWDTTLTILDSIKANFIVNDTCINKSFNFNNTSFGGKSTLTYTWNFGDDSTSIQTNPKHNYLNAKSHIVTLIASQNGECFDTSKQTINVYPLANGTLKYRDACYGDSTTLYNEYILPTGNVKDFKWTINGNIPKTDSSFKYKFLISGKQLLDLEYTTDRGCISKIHDSIFVNPLPIAKLWTNGIDAVCFGQSLRLVDSSQTMDSIVQSEIRFLNYTSNTKEYNYTTDSIGDRTFYIHVVSKYGCEDSSLKTIKVNPGPVVDFTGQDVCQLVNQKITNLTTLQSGSISSWEWKENNSIFASIESPDIVFSSSGMKYIKLIAQSNNGCKDSLEKTLNIWDLPVASFLFDTACFGLANNFTNISSLSNGTITNTNWDFGDGSTGTITNPSKIYGGFGNYNVSLEIITDKNCKDTITNEVTVGEIPTVDFSADNQIGCIPQEMQFTDLSSVTSGRIASWSWDFGNLNSSTEQAPQTTYTTAGKYNVSLTVTSNLGCSNQVIKNEYIEIFNLPSADFTMNPDTPTFLNPDVSFADISVGNGIGAWDWSFGNGDIDNIQNPFYAFTDTGLYYITLVVTDMNGCKDTAIKSIFLTPILKFHMPNSFFPNENGKNDVFKPGGIFQGINDYSISIYNRWGEQMYSGTDPEEGWDGTFGGKPAPMGVYFYKIRYTDYLRSKWFDLSGDITLLR